MYRRFIFLVALFLTGLLPVCAEMGDGAGAVYVRPEFVPETAVHREGIGRALGSRISLILADHRSLTISEQPTLYWYASGEVRQVEHLLYEGNAARPLLHETIQALPGAGFYALSLKHHGIRLRPEVPYRWVVKLLPEGSGQASTQLRGEIMLARPSRETSQQLAAASPAARPAILGGAGLWCDLIESMSELIERGTNRNEWLARRAQVLRQVGLIDAARADEARLPLTVSFSAGKTRFKAGDALGVTMRGNQRFYARILYEDAAGNRMQLLPNALRSDNVFEGQVPVRFPEASDPALTISAPFGKERLILQASASPLGSLAGDTLPNGFIRLHETLPGAHAPDFVQRTLEIVTEPKP